MHQYRIEHVQKITNGDTMQVVVDLGFYTTTTVAIRLLGVNVPEFGTFDRQGNDKGMAARNFTVEWFREHPKPFVLHTTRDRRDGFQRWYGTIFDAEGRALADDLIDNGFAVEFDDD